MQEKSELPIERAKMRVKVTIAQKNGKQVEEGVREKVKEGAEKIDVDELTEAGWEVVSPSYCLLVRLECADWTSKVLLIDPGQFRVINEILQKECKGRGRIETLDFAATAAPAAT